MIPDDVRAVFRRAPLGRLVEVAEQVALGTDGCGGSPSERAELMRGLVAEIALREARIGPAFRVPSPMLRKILDAGGERYHTEDWKSLRLRRATGLHFPNR